MSLSEFIGMLALAANIGIAVMIIILLGERSHVAWNRVRLQAEELTALRENLERQAEESEKVMQQMRDDIADLGDKLKRAEQDVEALQKRHRETDLPVGYAVLPADMVDRRFRTWRLVVRHPTLGMDPGSFSHPAHRWTEGRYYEIPGPNAEYAAAALQQRFTPREGFTVEVARETVADVAEVAL
ncbi:MAG TPA: hypothetical protein VKZ87_05200 [Ferrovibrio sp.]|nr:hypothetical protein [Ferrovibrio sp.]